MNCSETVLLTDTYVLLIYKLKRSSSAPLLNNSLKKCYIKTWKVLVNKVVFFPSTRQTVSLWDGAD